MSEHFDVSLAVLSGILDAIPEFVTVIDRDGVIRYTNRVEHGFDRDAVIGVHASSILSPDSLDVFQSTLESVLETGAEQQYDSMVHPPSGAPQWYRARMLPLRRDGEIREVVLLATNISELKAAREQIIQLRQLLPMCSWCDRIQDGSGTWQSVESYLEREADTKVTHGLCTACFQRQLDELDESEHDGAA
jgi:PAS domain S-box-containing protein